MFDSFIVLSILCPFVFYIDTKEFYLYNEIMFHKKINNQKFSYVTKKCSSLTDSELKHISRLFSENYGIYSKNHPKQELQGKQIKLGLKYYQNLAKNNHNYVALAYYDRELVGQAFYVIENTSEGAMTWVIQLVIDKKYRRHQVAKKLLFSIWGFSNDRAWGLATTNPVTIKTLESATMRKVSLSAMQKNINLIKQIAQKIDFVKETEIFISSENSVVNSTFFVSHEDIPDLIAAYGENWVFGNLEEGYEWLAFVFSGQEISEISQREFEKIIEHSEKCLVDAYSRMNMREQPWTKHTNAEVDFIKKYIPSKECFILDIGCGFGRHISCLHEEGYYNLRGIDFSEKQIFDAKETNPKIKDYFFIQDCRNFHLKTKADVIFCLYDVIGSFANQDDNLKIVSQIKRNLKKGGVAIVSVMNMELTKNIANPKNIFDVNKNIKRLFKLKASDIMQKSGNIFNPDYFVIDEKTSVVYRKEMFKGDGLLDSEYIVRDRRYAQKEIESMFIEKGFSIIDSRFVQAGHWDVPLKNTDLKAKEILLVVKKN